MTDSELKTLKDNLWHAADVLRAGAHLAANKYGQPILGLIFLRYADILYKQHKAEIEAEYNKSKRAVLLASEKARDATTYIGSQFSDSQQVRLAMVAIKKVFNELNYKYKE